MKMLLLLTAMLLPLTAKANERVVLTPENTAVYRGEIDGSSAVNMQLELAKLVAKRGLKNYPIYLVLDSPGGSIEAGFMFIQFAKLIPNLHTISIFAASMASAIAEQLPGRRLVADNGTMMFHQAYAGAEGTVEVGSLEAQLYYIKRRVLSLEVANANRMRTSIKDYKALISKELWLDSADSIRYRAADAVVDIDCSMQLINTMQVLTLESVFGSVAIKFSACPLFRVPLAISNAKVKYNLPAVGRK